MGPATTSSPVRETDWDGGDCCPTGFIKGCAGACGWADYLGDGGCDPAFDCIEMDQDQGDCGECGDGYCNAYNENETLCGGVVSVHNPSGNNDCGDPGFCGAGYIVDCWGGCSPEIALADGNCDASFSCIVWNWDGGGLLPRGREACVRRWLRGLRVVRRRELRSGLQLCRPELGRRRLRDVYRR